MSSVSPLPETPSKTTARSNESAGSAWFTATMGLLVFLFVPAALVLSIVWWVPEGNDYALSTRLKHERLEKTQNRLVLVGGSNLAYGIDSALLETETGRQVTNLGMNGYFGVRFMLEEVRSAVAPGDIVVIALEYDSFVKSPDGTASDLLMAIKARPESLEYLSRTQKIELLKALPYVAQMKLVRLIKSEARSIVDKVRGEQPGNAEKQLESIETLRGFEEHGDLTSHLGVVWPYERERGYDLSHLELDPELLPLLTKFAADLKSREVEVVLSFTPVEQTYFEEHRKAIEAIHHTFQKHSGLLIPSAPSAFVYPGDSFFDTVYHLNERGRPERTRRLAADLGRLRP